MQQLATTGNTLFPVFLRLEHFNVLIVGGGNAGFEKLRAVLRNSPATKLTLLGETILPEIRVFTEGFPDVTLLEKHFERSDLDHRQLIIIATDDPHRNRQIKSLAAARGILANVADTPELCDFYLSSVVQKGDLKIAISTNGKSPTLAKRVKETLHESLPDELDDVAQNLHALREHLKGDFAHKVRILNHVTRKLAARPEGLEKFDGRRWRRIATGALTAFGILLLTNIVFMTGLQEQIAPEFWPFLAVGFFAQMIDGMLGMGYGITAAIGLMTLNVPIAAVSSSVHTAEMFASGASGYSHYRFGNVKRDLFRALLFPGVIGAIAGALLLSWLDGRGSELIKPILAAYMMVLGVRILYRAFYPQTGESEIKRVGWLAGIGGFLDSFGGGGWGPLVTGTLITKGRTPRYVIGSVSLSEFFVTLASALTFFAAIGIGHWPVILGLTVGGIAAAPLAARLVGRLPTKKMLVGVGLMIMLWSVVTLVKFFW